MSKVDALKRHTSLVPQGSGKPAKQRCNFCSNVFSGMSRIITHFAGVKGKPGAEAKPCEKVPADVRAAALQHLPEALRLPSGKRPAADEGDDGDEVLEVAPASKQSRASTGGSSTSTQAQITSYTTVLKHDAAQVAVCNWLFECGIPFNVTRHPAWHEMWDAVRKAGPGFQPLSYNTVRTTALTKVRVTLI